MFFLFQGSSYAIGNAAYHNGDLYIKLKPCIPLLVELLRDPVSKTKGNAASKWITLSCKFIEDCFNVWQIIFESCLQVANVEINSYCNFQNN